jgi:cbb3-type cytochrome oxidase maturation protein
MEIVYLLVPIAIVLALVVVGLFFWSIRSGQFDDLEGPAHRILMDNDARDDATDGGGATTRTREAGRRQGPPLRATSGTGPGDKRPAKPKPDG